MINRVYKGTRFAQNFGGYMKVKNYRSWTVYCRIKAYQVLSKYFLAKIN